jgi:hypothetical protein
MKTQLTVIKAIIFFAFIFVFSCRKSVISEITTPVGELDTLVLPKVDSIVPIPQTGIIQCLSGPNYGDSIIFPQPTNPGQDFIISTVNNPGVGTYLSWPQGMVIDKNTGSINVSKSETGIRFTVGFIKSGSTDTCLQTIILAGSSYIDSIYVLNSNDTIAAPYFNANPYSPSSCQSGNGCSFDISGNASKKGIDINHSNGAIKVKDYKKIFGYNPFNGEVIMVPIDYSINDNSNNAIQQISVAMVYFDKKSHIPSNVLEYVRLKRQHILQNVIIDAASNPRPPLIIVTRLN